MVGCTTVFYACQDFSKNVVAVVDLGSSGVIVSCGCVACLKLEPDYQVEINSLLEQSGEEDKRCFL